jgi:hypothetical protein
MADREVTQTGKDKSNEIISLCNPKTTWSPRTKEDAIRDIESGDHTYCIT